MILNAARVARPAEQSLAPNRVEVELMRNGLPIPFLAMIDIDSVIRRLKEALHEQ